MKTYAKGILTSLIIITSFSSLTFWAHKEGVFDLKELSFEVRAPREIQESKIMQLYQMSAKQKLNHFNGASLLAIDVDEIEDILKKENWVDKVSIRRVFPDSIRIEVNPKVWLAYWYNNGSFYPYTSGGEVLKEIPILQAPDLPILRLEKKDFNRFESHLLNVLKKLPPSGALSHQTLQEIGVDREGLYLNISPGLIKVRLGLDDIDLRIERSKRVLKYLEDRHLQGRVINADFEKKIVVKLRKAR